MTVRVEKRGPIWTILISRPERRNAVDRATAQRLADAFRAFDAEPTAAVAVLAGDGATFCAGADLKAIAAGDGNRVERDGDAPMGPTRLVLSKPTIAAVAGHAVGGGMELALWCDLRIVEEDATLGFFNRRWGVPLIDGGTARLPRLIGLSRALDLILTGRAIEAPEALAIGLAHRIAPTGSARRIAEALAHEIAAFPQHALRGDRMAALEGLDTSLAAALDNEFARGQDALRHETVSGARAFAKR